MHHTTNMGDMQILRNPASRKSEILSELQTVLDSNAFRTSPRAREFLTHVVHEVLDGNAESLKERSIGVNLYHRPTSYLTGEDPVVRVKAAEVRRRLSKYHAECDTPNVRIELPVGSYVPLFHIPEASSEQAESPEPAAYPSATTMVPIDTREASIVSRWSWSGVRLLMFGAVILSTVFILFSFFRPVSVTHSFWAPLLSRDRAVLVYVPSPVSYALSSRILKQMNGLSANTADFELAMNTTPIHLDPEAVIKGSEITPLVDYSVNKDDAYVIAGLSGLFTRLGQTNELRIGKDLAFADLRSSPAVLVGAFNNPWTLKMSADLPYQFGETAGIPFIQERANSAHIFSREVQGRMGNHDFAIIARLLNSNTGQPLVIIAGTGMVGTEAAGRLLCNEAMLSAALAGAPKDWSKKNLELMLETQQVDGDSSQPKVIALKTW